MAKMRKDEIAVLKAFMVELDPKTVMLVTYQYHSELGDNGKCDRSKTLYRWLSRVMTKEEVQNTIEWCWKDENRLNRFRWPNDKLPYYFAAEYSENNCVAGFFATKLKKLISWEDGVKQMMGYKISRNKKKKPSPRNPKLSYAILGYTADNGDIVNLNDREALLKHVGQNLYHANKPDPKDLELPDPEQV